MPMKTFARHRRVALLLMATAMLAGCAGISKTPEDVVVERAKARWDAVISGDYETAYSYYTPGYRSSTSLVDFALVLRARRVNWTSASYVDHQCEEKRCKLTFKIGFRLIAPLPGVTTYNGFQFLEDTWILTDGEWWYLPPKD